MIWVLVAIAVIGLVAWKATNISTMLMLVIIALVVYFTGGVASAAVIAPERVASSTTQIISLDTSLTT